VEAAPQRFVYLLRSLAHSSRYYVGLTSDVHARLVAHNAGLSPYTSRSRPWKLLVAIEFEEEAAALAFEKYLKSGSGRAFAMRHFRAPQGGDI
jgi:predicted GIY-YIG superfamily endonuclease